MGSIVLDMVTNFDGPVGRAIVSVQGLNRSLAETGSVASRASGQAIVAQDRLRESSDRTLSSIVRMARNIGAILGAGALFRKAITEAIEYEGAVNNLSAALVNQGQFSAVYVGQLQAQAKALEDTSTFSRMAILSAQGILVTYGATGANLEILTKATGELAAATGKDLDEAARQVGKTLGGYAGELGELVPQLKGLTAEQLKAGEAGRIIADIFGGRMREKLTTFGGQVEQLRNKFDSWLGSMGNVILDSEVLRGGLDSLRAGLEDTGRSTETFRIIFDTIFAIGKKVVDVFDFVAAYLNSTITNLVSSFSIISKLFNGLIEQIKQPFSRALAQAKEDINVDVQAMKFGFIEIGESAKRLADFETFLNIGKRADRSQTSAEDQLNAEREARSREVAEQRKRQAIQQTIAVQRGAGGGGGFPDAPAGFVPVAFSAGTGEETLLNPQTGEVQTRRVGSNVTINAVGVLTGAPGSQAEFDRVAARAAVSGDLNNAGGAAGVGQAGILDAPRGVR